MFKNLNKNQKTLLLVLAGINFFNYVDRQIVFPLFHLIKKDFSLTDFQLGLLGTMFMLVYSVASVPLGMLADKYSRKSVIGFGVFFWSVASFASGLAGSFKSLLMTRSLVGIGEASYAPAATAMIADNLPQTFWARAQGVFNIAMFVGGTVGAMLGGVIAFYFQDWRHAFFLSAVPGFFFAWWSLYLNDKKQPHPKEEYKILQLFKNPAFVWILISGTLVTFSVGGFVAWGIEFITRYKAYNLRDASLILGLTLMLAGVLGVLLGGWLADYFQKKVNWGRSMVVTVSLLLAGPFMYFGLAENSSQYEFFIFFFLGTMLLAAYQGPATAVIHEVVPKHLRATAFAVYVLVIHLLGDTISPAVIGKFSDIYSLQKAMSMSTILVFFSGLAFLFVMELIRTRKVELLVDHETEFLA